MSSKTMKAKCMYCGIIYLKWINIKKGGRGSKTARPFNSKTCSKKCSQKYWYIYRYKKNLKLKNEILPYPKG